MWLTRILHFLLSIIIISIIIIRLFSSSSYEYDLLSEVPVVTAEKVAEEEECAPASR